MAHFVIETNDDGSVRHIICNGEIHPGSVKFEQLFSIVTFYFSSAYSNIEIMEKEEIDSLRRRYGIQSFMMSLTGVEAFTNTYFRLRGHELGNPLIGKRVDQRHGTLAKKVKELIAMTPEGEIENQDMVLDRLHELYQLRNTLVHPHWQPDSVTMLGRSPIKIEGLVQNIHAVLEDHSFCRISLMWCLLLLASIGRSRKNTDVTSFLYMWTGIHGLTEKIIKSELDISQFKTNP